MIFFCFIEVCVKNEENISALNRNDLWRRRIMIVVTEKGFFVTDFGALSEFIVVCRRALGIGGEVAE